MSYLKQSLSLAERNVILEALEKTNWVKKEAAKLLGITRTTLYRKLKQYNIRPNEQDQLDSISSQK